MTANRPMRSVANFELIEADDPRELTVLLNLAVDAIAERGGSLVQSHLPDILRWQSLDERHPLCAMLEFVLPDAEAERPETTEWDRFRTWERSLAENPLPQPLITPTPLRVVPFVGQSGNGT